MAVLYHTIRRDYRAGSLDTFRLESLLDFHVESGREILIMSSVLKSAAWSSLLLLLIVVNPAKAQLVNSEWNTGNGSWNVAGNWAPNDVPDNGGGFTYDVEIGNRAVAAGAQVTFTPEDGTTDTITSLLVTNTGNALVSGADLLLNGNQLVVVGQTTIEGSGSTIRVDNHATPGTVAFSTNTLDLNNGGGLTMEGGIATVNIQFEINVGTLSGHGTVNVGDNDAFVELAFENSSLIQPSSNSAAPQTLTIHSNGVDTIDLDGTTENGTVDVSNALANVNADTVTLIVDGPLSDAFSGTLQIGQRDTLTFNDNFTMDGADVQMSGGTQIATLNGPGNITNIASSVFTITGDAVIDNDLTFTGPGNTVTVNAGGSLTLNGAASTSDASMLSLAAGSELVVNSSLTVIEAGGDIDLDGTGNNAIITIGSAGHLNLTVDQVDVGNNIFNGTINLNDGGDLTVNNTINSWQAAGVVNKNGAGISSINGDEFAVTGDLVIDSGTLDVNASAIFGSTSDIIIANGATADMATTEIHVGADVTVNGTLSLGIASILEAATLDGTGLFRLNSTSTITGNAVINTTSFDWDGLGGGTTHTINNGVVFTVNSTIWDAEDSGDVDDNINLGGNGAQIIVNNVANWTMARTLNANTALAGTATIGGTSRVTFAGASSILNVDGDTDINAPITFGSLSITSIDAGMALDLGASANYEGGAISGAGIFVPATQNLVTQSTTISAATFDFDAGNWQVTNNALLTVVVTDYDAFVAPNAFDLTLQLNNGDISITTGDAEFVMDGTLLMHSSIDGQITTWSGEPLDIGNDNGALDADLNVTGTRQSQIAAQVDFNSDADVNVAPNATLNFLNTVIFDTVNAANNAEFTGAGTMAFSGVVNVNEAVTLNMVGGTVDLDGLDNAGDFVNIDAPMTINATEVPNFGRVNGGGGTNTLDINNSVGTGVLTVNLDDPADEWTLNGPGVMNLVNDNAVATLLAGSDVNLNGTVNVTGNVRTTARVDIAGVVNINTAGQPLRLGGGNNTSDVNTIAGANISGLGLLGADTAKALHGFGTINTAIDFDGTANLRASGGTLNITGAIVDVNILGTADNTGILNILNAWETDGGAGASIGSVVLNGGVLQGAQITNDNITGLQGHGTITSRVINNSRIVANNGGTLIVQTAGNNNDWDGAANTGRLEALSGDIEMIDTTNPLAPPVRQFGGSVQAVGDNRVFANGFALDFNPGSSLELEDTATYRASSSTDIGGTVTVDSGANATIQVANNFFLTFETGSTTTLDGDLTLLNNNINIEQGAVFVNGGGALKIPDGSHMVADNQADIDVLVDMQGAFRPGNFNGIGRVELFEYQQGNTGELYVEIIGTSLNQFDRLVVGGDVVLDGYLNIDIDEISPGVPFVPALNQTFNIITGNIIGEFDYADVSGMPAGLAFHIEYLGNAVQLQVVNKPFFSADFDEDGDVDLTDLAIWQGAYNLNQLGDADGDNDSDGRDFLLWQRQHGSAPLVAVSTAVPEPGCGTLVILILSGPVCHRRKTI
jgi:hypothetical protein